MSPLFFTLSERKVFYYISVVSIVTYLARDSMLQKTLKKIYAYVIVLHMCIFVSFAALIPTCGYACNLHNVVLVLSPMCTISSSCKSKRYCNELNLTSPNQLVGHIDISITCKKFTGFASFSLPPHFINQKLNIIYVICQQFLFIMF